MSNRYQNPEDLIAGQAPIGVNDNYMFYCVNGEYRQLMFGQCEEVYRPIDDTVAFNRIMQQKTSLTVMSLFEQFFSRLAANGIRYTVEQMGQEPNPGIHFPVKFYMTRNGRPATLERILDDLIA